MVEVASPPLPVALQCKKSTVRLAMRFKTSTLPVHRASVVDTRQTAAAASATHLENMMEEWVLLSTCVQEKVPHEERERK